MRYVKMDEFSNDFVGNFKVMLLFVVILLLFFNCKSNVATTAISNNLSPSETVRLYWDASYYGKADVVSQLITKEPKSFSERCKSKDGDNEELEKGEKIAVKPLNFSKNEGDIKSKSANEGVFSKYYDKNSEFFSIYSTSHLININKMSARNLVIEDEFTFEDESRVNLYYEYPNVGKLINSSIFLKKEANGWRIFLILDKSSLYLFDNENYGKKKLNCIEQLK